MLNSSPLGISEFVMDGQGGGSKSTADRRPKPRKRVLLAGIVAHSNGAHSFNCHFRNLSDSGARIFVGRDAQFPTELFLINVRDQVAYQSRVIWNNGSEVGITYTSTLPLAEITDPSLNYLKRLWLARRDWAI